MISTKTSKYIANILKQIEVSIMPRQRDRVATGVHGFPANDDALFKNDA